MVASNTAKRSVAAEWFVCTVVRQDQPSAVLIYRYVWFFLHPILILPSIDFPPLCFVQLKLVKQEFDIEKMTTVCLSWNESCTGCIPKTHESLCEACGQSFHNMISNLMFAICVSVGT